MLSAHAPLDMDCVAPGPKASRGAVEPLFPKNPSAPLVGVVMDGLELMLGQEDELGKGCGQISQKCLQL